MLLAGLLLAAVHVNSLAQVCFGTECFQVEVATTEKSQSKGLMFRGSLARDRGMLFTYKKEGWPVMYMKNMRIPLDMIWLNQKKEVVHIESSVPACTAEPCPRYFSTITAMYVLELNAGTAEQLGLQVGDQARFLSE